MKIQALLADLQLTKASAVRHVEYIPARDARYAALEPPLPAPLVEALRHQGIERLYTHQAAYVAAARAGENVVAVTPTASGKTLCFLLPVLERLSKEGGTALFLYPTKALSQDQLRGLNRFLALAPGLGARVKAGVYDGDTPPAARRKLRDDANVLITNPDMLHTGILPHHARWARFFAGLKFVVVDELHAYRGIFGSHVANVFRRLSRVAAHYGAGPQFLLSSATIANPREHAERLVGAPVTLIEDSGAPQGEKYFVVLNPPLADKGLGLRRSANVEAVEVLAALVKDGVQAVAFARARVVAELLYKYARDAVGPKLADKVKSYRGGYLAEERRAIERQLFGGELLGVTATNALELGIDVGGLDAAIIVGFPGSLASLKQQAGRAGRRTDTSVAVLVCYDDPVDQYLARHPAYIFGRPVEDAIVDPQNVYILHSHLRCAAHELPLAAEDLAAFGAGAAEVAAAVADDGELSARDGKYWWISADYPAAGVNLRASTGNTVTIVDATRDNAVIGSLDYESGLEQLYPEAVYLHQGESYLISELHLDSHTAVATPTEAPYYTQTKELNDLRIVKLTRDKSCGQVKVHLGEVEVTTTVVGFKKKAQFTEEVIGEEPLDLPPQRFPTVGLWFDLPPEAVAQLDREQLDFAGGLHAAEHAAIAILPLFALCDRNDIGGLSTPLHPDTGRAQIFIYDAYPGGIGIAEKGFDLVEQLWETTLKAITECPCQEGCPSCIQSPKCGNNNKPLDKKAAQILLEGLLKE